MSALGRLHVVWILAHAGDNKTLFQIAEGDSDPRVRAQAVRAIGDLFDPVLVEHSLAADRGDPKIARRLAALGRPQDHPRVMFEVTVALGRLRWSESPAWLKANIPGGTEMNPNQMNSAHVLPMAGEARSRE